MADPVPARRAAGVAARLNDRFDYDAKPGFEITAEDRDLIARLVATEVDHRLAKSDPEEYYRQIQGVVDTVINRAASGKFGDSVAAVINQKNQFSAINGPTGRGYPVYGSVDKVPDKVVPAQMRALVDDWIDSRIKGARSSVQGGLHYANPYFSDDSNRAWINALDGPKYGKGKSIHYHGTMKGYEPYEARVVAPRKSTNANLDDQRAEQAAMRNRAPAPPPPRQRPADAPKSTDPPLPRKRPDDLSTASETSAAQTITVNGHVYRIGDTFTAGISTYAVTPTGIEKTGTLSSGKPNVMDSVIAKMTVDAVKEHVPAALDAAKTGVGKMGADLAATGGNLLTGAGNLVSGAGTILGGLFGGGAAKPSDVRTVLTANMAGRGLPVSQPVAPVPALQSPDTAAKRGAVLTSPSALRVASLDPTGIPLSPLTSPTILGKDVTTLGPTMPRGALAARRAAAAKAQQEYAAAEARRTAAVVAAKAAAAAAGVKASADAAQRFSIVRTQQAAATTAARVTAATTPAYTNIGSPGAYVSPTFAEMTNRTVEEIQTYRANKEANGGKVFGA